MSLNRRLGCLERTAQHREYPELTQRLRGEEDLLRAHATTEAAARYDAASARMAAACEATDSEELGAASDAYLDALETLDNERKVTNDE